MPVSSVATFTVQDVPELAARGGRRYALDCPHGTTGVWFIPSAALDLSETQLLAIALERHDAEEGCACTGALWQRVATAQAHL